MMYNNNWYRNIVDAKEFISSEIFTGSQWDLADLGLEEFWRRVNEGCHRLGGSIVFRAAMKAVLMTGVLTTDGEWYAPSTAEALAEYKTARKSLTTFKVDIVKDGDFDYYVIK